MKKIIKNLIKVVLLLIVINIILSRPIQADVGYFSSYDSGSSSSYDSDFAWSPSDGSSSYSGGGYSSPESRLIGVALYVATIIIIIIVYKVAEKNTKKANQIKITSSVIDNTNSIEADIRKIDPLFSAENFMAYSREVFVKLQTAWMEKKWEEIRPFESNELFEQHKQQLQYLIDNNKTNIMEKICVRYTCLNSFKQEGDKEVIKMTLKSVMKDYIIDDKTKKCSSRQS